MRDSLPVTATVHSEDDSHVMVYNRSSERDIVQTIVRSKVRRSISSTTTIETW